jgi:hypothetical protein
MVLDCRMTNLHESLGWMSRLYDHFICTLEPTLLVYFTCYLDKRQIILKYMQSPSGE